MLMPFIPIAGGLAAGRGTDRWTHGSQGPGRFL